MTELDELRTQLRRVIELTYKASARPTPTDASEATAFVCAVDEARHALAVVVMFMRGVCERVPADSGAEARELIALVHDVRRAGDQLAAASRAALAAAERYTAN